MSFRFDGRNRLGGESRTAQPGDVSKARSFYASGVVVATLLVLCVFLVFSPSDAVVSPRYARFMSPVGQVLPQGWAFFTRDPRSNYVSLYQQEDGTWEQVNATTVAARDNFYGLSRASRTESYEIESITSELPEGEWNRCEEEEIILCFPETPRAEASVDLHGVDLRFCGVLAVTSQEPTPWAWGSLVGQMPGEYMIVDVTCHPFERKEE